MFDEMGWGEAHARGVKTGHYYFPAAMQTPPYLSKPELSQKNTKQCTSSSKAESEAKVDGTSGGGG